MSISGLIHAYHMLAVNKFLDKHNNIFHNINITTNNLNRMTIKDVHKFLRQIAESAKCAERLNNKYKFIDNKYKFTGGDLNA